MEHGETGGAFPAYRVAALSPRSLGHYQRRFGRAMGTTTRPADGSQNAAHASISTRRFFERVAASVGSLGRGVGEISNFLISPGGDLLLLLLSPLEQDVSAARPDAEFLKSPVGYHDEDD